MLGRIQSLENHPLQLSTGPTRLLIGDLSQRTSDGKEIVTGYNVWNMS
jgi:hypothetical protein